VGKYGTALAANYIHKPDKFTLASPTWIIGPLVTGLLQFPSMKQNEIFRICDTINKLLPKPI